MAENSGIEWTDHTFNPWWGCAKISPGCDNCYAEALAKRLHPSQDVWQVNGERRFFARDHWEQPLRWERKAMKEGRRFKVFCASMADVFDNSDADEDAVHVARHMLWDVIRKTPHLDWLILTKRIGNANAMLPKDWFGLGRRGFPNVWLGISVVNQMEFDRDILKLLRIPARVHFLSCEPLLGPMSVYRQFAMEIGRLDWVIVGGESGHKARPMEVRWVENIVGECELHRTPVFVKQGSQANWPRFKDFESFPKHLQVRQWPKT